MFVLSFLPFSSSSLLLAVFLLLETESLLEQGFSALKELELRGELEEKIQQALLEPEDPEFQEILAISQPPSFSSSSSSFYPSLLEHNLSSSSGDWVVSPEVCFHPPFLLRTLFS